ncbi:hypothetical protein ACWGH3_13750 [Streptomyces sp. NPDC054884]
MRGLRAPVLLLVAANSRTHDARTLAARVGEAVRELRTIVLPDVSRQALPHAAPCGTGRRLTAFLCG